MEIKCACGRFIDPSVDTHTVNGWVCRYCAGSEGRQLSENAKHFHTSARQYGGKVIVNDHGAVIESICKRLEGERSTWDQVLALLYEGQVRRRFSGGVCKAITLYYMVCFDPEHVEKYTEGFQEFCSKPKSVDVIFQFQAMEASTSTLVRQLSTYDAWSLVPFSSQFLSPVPTKKLADDVLESKSETQGLQGLSTLISSLFPKKATRVDSTGELKRLEQHALTVAAIPGSGRYLFQLDAIHATAAIVIPEHSCFIFIDCNFGQAVFHNLTDLQGFVAYWLDDSRKLYGHTSVQCYRCLNLGTYEPK